MTLQAKKTPLTTEEKKEEAEEKKRDKDKEKDEEKDENMDARKGKEDENDDGLRPEQCRRPPPD